MASRRGAGAIPVFVDLRDEHSSGDNGEDEQQDQHGSNSALMNIAPPVAVMPWCIDLLPYVCQGRHMKTVAVIVQDGAEPFGLGSICEVWGEPYHPEDDNLSLIHI